MNPIRISLVLGALAIGSAAIAQSTPPAAADVPSSAQATDPAGKAPGAAAPLPPPERGMHRHGMHHGGHAHHDAACRGFVYATAVMGVTGCVMAPCCAVSTSTATA